VGHKKRRDIFYRAVFLGSHGLFFVQALNLELDGGMDQRRVNGGGFLGA
jgi:hypothetical protein